MDLSNSSTRALAWVALIATLAGCGTSEYNKHVASRVARARGEAKFRTLYAPMEIPDTPLKIRMPMVFTHEQLYDANSKHSQDGGTIKPERLQPPFLKIPGFKYCFEGQGTTPEGRKLPFYCYLGTIPGTTADLDKLTSDLNGQLQETFKDATLNWDPVDCESPSGIAIPWRKLRLESEQPFMLVDGQGNPVVENQPAIFEIWVTEKQGHILIMAWRVPKAVDAPAGQPAAPQPGALPFAVPTGDAKPDMSSMPALVGGTLEATEPAPTASG